MPENIAPDLYRNRDFIPDFDEIMAETAARSRALAAHAEMRANIAYGPRPRERMDLILPPNLKSGAPLHLFVHGGYWRAGCKEDHRLVAAPVLAAGGIAAIVGYDLMPATRLAVLVAQVRQAMRHLVAMAPGFGADPARVTVSGHSAGAHLASYLAAQGVGEPPPGLPTLRGMLLVSGIYDLSGIPGSFLKDEARMRPEEAAAWSPLDARHDPGPERVLTRGAAETAPFHDQAARMAALLPGSTLRCEPGLNHLSVVLALADPGHALGRRLADMVSG